MKLTPEEKRIIKEKRLENAVAKCPEIPRDVLDKIIKIAESGPAYRDGGRSIKRSIANQAAAWGFMQATEQQTK